MTTKHTHTPGPFYVASHMHGYSVAKTGKAGSFLRHPTQGHILTFSDAVSARWYADRENAAIAKARGGSVE